MSIAGIIWIIYASVCGILILWKNTYELGKSHGRVEEIMRRLP